MCALFAFDWYLYFNCKRAPHKYPSAWGYKLYRGYRLYWGYKLYRNFRLHRNHTLYRSYKMFRCYRRCRCYRLCRGHWLYRDYRLYRSYRLYRGHLVASTVKSLLFLHISPGDIFHPPIPTLRKRSFLADSVLGHFFSMVNLIRGPFNPGGFPEVPKINWISW